MVQRWQKVIVRLARQVCSVVDPDVRTQSDLLDIRQYVKIKTVPGGAMDECAYVDGVVFRKSVVHKKMVRPLQNPRVLLLAGGIEFQRSNSRMASFDTLLEQERHYIQILVEKIVALRPDLVLVGQAVSRQAQEYLEQHEVVVIQHVKAKLMKRVARAVGATIFNSTDHVMNHRPGGGAGGASTAYSSTITATGLGRCALFHTIAFPSPKLEARTKMQRMKAQKMRGKRGANQKQAGDSAEPDGDDEQLEDTFDDEAENDSGSSSSSSDEGGDYDNDEGSFLKVPHMKRERGHGYVTHVFLEGCPEDLGCTLVLRGASKAALKQAKSVTRFALSAAYNLRLEIAYLNNRNASLERFASWSTSAAAAASLPASPPLAASALSPVLDARKKQMQQLQLLSSSPALAAASAIGDGGGLSTALSLAAVACDVAFGKDEAGVAAAVRRRLSTSLAVDFGDPLVQALQASGGLGKMELAAASAKMFDDCGGGNGNKDPRKTDKRTKVMLGKALSSSLGFGFGGSRGVRSALVAKRPVRPMSSQATEHQAILVTSVWMTNRTQCAPAEVKRILYYTSQDLGLGQFLLESCFNPTLKVHGERRSVLEVTQMFSHRTGRLSINVFKMEPSKLTDPSSSAGAPTPTDSASSLASYRLDSSGSTSSGTLSSLSPRTHAASGTPSGSGYIGSAPRDHHRVKTAAAAAGGGSDNMLNHSNAASNNSGSGGVAKDGSTSGSSIGCNSGVGSGGAGKGTSIRMWSYCKKCCRVVTPVSAMSEDTWKFSFGKFLETMFYNEEARGRTGGCTHRIQTDHVLFFGHQNLAARFEYETVVPFDILTQHMLPLDEKFALDRLLPTLEKLKTMASGLFQGFTDKTQELEEKAKVLASNHTFAKSSSNSSATLAATATTAAAAAAAAAATASSAGVSSSLTPSSPSSTVTSSSSSSVLSGGTGEESSNSGSKGGAEFLKLVLSELGQIQSEVHHCRVMLDKKVSEEKEWKQRVGRRKAMLASAFSVSAPPAVEKDKNIDKSGAAAVGRDDACADDFNDDCDGYFDDIDEGNEAGTDGEYTTGAAARRRTADRVQFPIMYRRELYLRCLYWNERLSAVGSLVDGVHSYHRMGGGSSSSSSGGGVGG